MAVHYITAEPRKLHTFCVAYSLIIFLIYKNDPSSLFDIPSFSDAIFTTYFHDISLPSILAYIHMILSFCHILRRFDSRTYQRISIHISLRDNLFKS